MSLTERAIRDLKPEGGKPKIIWDRILKGFGCKASAGGSKSYIVKYRAGGRQRMATIGRPAEIGLAEARRRAAKELDAVRQGGAGPLARREAAGAAPTVADAMGRYLDDHLPARVARGLLKPNTLRQYRAVWSLAAADWPAFGSVRVRDVTRADIERAVSKRAPVARNRALAMLSAAFNCFEGWELRPLNSNPTKRVERTREQPRDRTLAPAELQALARALSAAEAADLHACRLIKFLALTGWRKSEAQALQWSHINPETGRIVLPDSKTGRSVRTVGDAALALIEGMPRTGNPHVFAGARGRAIGSTRLRGVFKQAASAAGIDHCTLHDLRRTVATEAAASGLSVTLLRDLLGHKTIAMAQRYARRADSALKQAQNESADRMAAMMN